MKYIIYRALALISIGVLIAVATVAPIQAEKAQCPVSNLPLFNDPSLGKADQYKIMSYVKECIYASAPGSYIRIANPRFDNVRIAEALVWARDNKRHVQVIFADNLEDPNRATKLLVKRLGTDTSRHSFVKFCKSACLSSDPKGDMHNKLFVFSDSGGNKNITMITSINIIDRQSQTRFNDLYTVTDPQIYNDTVKYFHLMKRDKPAAYKVKTATDTYEMWYMPYYGSDQPDFYLKKLNETRCTTTKAVGTNGRTVIDWYSPQLMNTPELVDRAVQMTGNGCRLRMLVSFDNIGKKGLWKLYRGNVDVRYLWSNGDPYLSHSKTLAISGTHRNASVNTVYTGSRNAVDSQSRADNTMLRIINDKTVFDAYHEQFNYIWAKAHPLTKEAIEEYAAWQDAKSSNN